MCYFTLVYNILGFLHIDSNISRGIRAYIYKLSIIDSYGNSKWSYCQTKTNPQGVTIAGALEIAIVIFKM